MIEQSFIQELLNRVDIVDIISRHLPLKKAGANFTACCPFHNEKTPSFSVSPTKQFYHCFGCGRHGNAINFLMEHSGLNFVEAVEDLAAHVGVRIPVQETGRKASTEAKDRQHIIESKSFSSELHAVMKVAAKYYCAQLKQSNQAVAYLKARGVTGETALRFRIGYAPLAWQNLAGVLKDYPVNDPDHVLVRAGLVITRDDGKNYDRFRHRIMFPILDRKKNVVGFGGRALDGKEPKYLNSPETSLFTKGHELYNLVFASAAIRKAGRVIVVEGYMDVVMLSQNGIEYVVATLGTATTEIHIRKLLRYTDEIIFCFDGDEAGKKAAWRALETSLSQLKDGKEIRFLFLPDQEDPDSYVCKYGKEAFETLQTKALSLSVFLCSTLCDQIDLETSEGRTRLIKQAGALLTQIEAPIFAHMLMQRISELARVDQSQLSVFLKHKKKKNELRAYRPKIARTLSVTPYRRLIQILLHAPEYVKKLDRTLLVSIGDANSQEEVFLTELVNSLDMPSDSSAGLDVVTIMQFFDGSPHKALLREIVEDMPISEADWNIEAEFSGAVARLARMHQKRRITELHSRSLASLTTEERKELQRLMLSSTEKAPV